MAVRVNLGIFGHAIQVASQSVYHWAVFDFAATSNYILTSGCGRDKRDVITGSWVAVGKAAAWLKESGRTPRSVTVVARPEVSDHDPVYDVHKKMKAKIAEYIAETKAELIWDVANESDQKAMVFECQADQRMMEKAEALSRSAAGRT